MTARLLAAARAGDVAGLALFTEACESAHLDWAAWLLKSFSHNAPALPPLADPVHQFFEKMWIGYGEVIRLVVDNDRVLCDALRRLCRPWRGGHLKVYRGQSVADTNAGRHGLSWSTDKAAASSFGRWTPRLRVGGLVILAVMAPPAAVISQLRSGDALTDAALCEVLIDRRRLSAAPVIVQTFPEEQDFIAEAIAVAGDSRGAQAALQLDQIGSADGGQRLGAPVAGLPERFVVQAFG